MPKRVSTSSVKTVVTLFVILTAIIVIVITLWPLQLAPSPLTENKIKAHPVKTNEHIVFHKKTKLKASSKVVYSTPEQHDQLVISPSLEGTNIDGVLQADEQNQLVLEIGIRDFFDYFLSTADEIGPEAAISEIQRYANQYLPEPAKTQAVQLLEKYLGFKQTEYQLQQMPISQDSLSDKGAITLMRENFDSLKQKRQTLFNPKEEQALFGLEDTYAEHTLATLELMADETLNNKQINAGLQVLESNLPPELSNSFAQTRADNQQSELISTLVESTLDDAQLHSSLSDEGLDIDNVNDIIERRQQQSNFENSYQQYSKSLNTLDLQQANFEDQKQRLQQRYFLSPEEQTQAKLRDLNNN